MDSWTAHDQYGCEYVAENMPDGAHVGGFVDLIVGGNEVGEDAVVAETDERGADVVAGPEDADAEVAERYIPSMA